MTKAKSNCIAYRIPENRNEDERGRGRPRKKGARVPLSSLLSEKEKFKKATLRINGKDTELRIREETLL